MTEQAEFKEWPKIPRHKNLNICITEKIDGTNAGIIVGDEGVIGCQSRNKIITPQDDNYGFAGWVDRNKEELKNLGHGHHYGEWAGPGIQKNPLNLAKKQFFLFNSERWKDENRPACCEVVPQLYNGIYFPLVIKGVMQHLWESRQSLGQKPEGIIIYYREMRTYEKLTFESPEGKWAA